MRAVRSGRAAFRFVVASALVSGVGDQVTKVAVSVLVFQQTGSAALTALTYGLTLVPGTVGGLLWGGLADRYDRRTVLVACAASQAVLIAVAALPGSPFALVAFVVAGVSMLTAPAQAARTAAVSDVVDEERLDTALGSLAIADELAQLAGLAGAAGVVALAGTHLALAADAASFLIAAVLMAVLPALPPPGFTPPASTSSSGSESSRSMSAGSSRPAWRVILADPALRTVTGLALVVVLTMVPDGVMAPVVRELGQPAWLVGVLLAADCVGVVAGNLVMRRVPDRVRPRLLGPLSVLAFVPLVGFAWRPVPVVAVALLVASGMGAAYLPLTKAAFIQRVTVVAPDRLAATGALVGTTIGVGQGVLAILGGAAALVLGSPGRAIAVAGALGVVLALAGALRWRVLTRSVGTAANAPTSVTPQANEVQP